MSQDTPLLRSLRAAVAANPDDVPLRLHLAELLLDAGLVDESVSHIAAALHRVPGSTAARALMARAMATRGERADRPDRADRADWSAWADRSGNTERTDHLPAPGAIDGSASTTGRHARPPVPARRPRERQAGDDPPTERHSFNWIAAESQFADIPQPYVDSGTAPLGAPIMFDVETAQIRLADVGGMSEVKQRLTARFLAPLRHSEPRRGFGTAQRGGLLMYGPPGCGRTYLARAVAGELGARFLAVSMAELVDPGTGAGEPSLRDLFAEARRAAPCVLFLDELDAIGRTPARATAAQRGTVNQLLAELDSLGQAGESVYLLAASSQPWEIDAVLRRPGRLDRMLLVVPPDLPAREAILRRQLRDLPMTGVSVRDLAKRTEDFSSSDLAYLCETAVERAQLDGTRNGKPRKLAMRDFDAAFADVRASTGAWLSVARNVAVFGNPDGAYDDLHRYLKRRRMV